MVLFKHLILLVIFILPYTIHAQDKSAAAAADAMDGEEPRKPNAKRIRRQLNLIVGLEHDEEFLIPNKKITYGGRNTSFFDISRIKGTDYFRIKPTKAGSGIVTINDAETGQIYVEIRFDVRDDAVERMMREVQALLADIEGIEFKLINPQGGTNAPTILIDGFVLLPKDLVRISQVISNYDGKIKSLVTLSPVARQKIADFITRDVNNPEVKISAIGNFIKLEGQVNTKEEHARIKNIVKLYLPDIVTEKAPSFGNDSVQIIGRKPPAQDDEFILDLIVERPPEDKVEPPPKLIQIVAHFVKFNDNYSKSFNFKFAPAVSAVNGAGGVDSSSIASTIALLNNLLPKLQWARFHGFAKVLDTASVLVQDKKPGSITRTLSVGNPQIAVNGQQVQPTRAGVTLVVTPTIKSERSGLIELGGLNVTVGAGSKSEPESTIVVNTTISVRDRQSAAFGGILRKNSESNYGAPADDTNPIITFNAAKDYNRSNSQFVVFVTPIIKSSASTGVDQVKKKFRLRD